MLRQPPPPDGPSRLGFLAELIVPRLPHPGAPQTRHRRSGIKVSFLEGSWAQIFITLTGGKFLTDLLLHFGATASILGLGSSIQPFASTLQIAGAYLSNAAGSRKKVIVPACLVCRQAWWLVLPLLFLDLPQTAKVSIFLGVYFVSMVADAIIANIWMSWTADLVPDAVRGKVMGLRNALMLGISIFADFGISRLREVVGLEGRAFYLAVCFATAASAGLVTAQLFRRQWEPPLRRDPPPPLREIFSEALSHPGARRLITARALWNVAVGIAVAFWTPFMMNNLGLPFTTIAIYNVIVQGLTVVLGALLWGPVIDRAGTVPVIMINGVVIGLMPFLYLFATPENLTCYWIDAVATGICWSGFNAAIFNLPFQVLPERRRDFHLAAMNAIAGTVLGASAVVGGLIAEWLQPIRIEYSGRVFGNFHVMFVLSGVLRLSALAALARVPDIRGRGIAFTLFEIGSNMKELVTNPRLVLVKRYARKRRTAQGK